MQENIMINANGHAFIIDFGSSLFLQPGAASTTSSHDKSPGNFRWIAPETMQHGHYPITPKADVWSFAGLGIEVNCICTFTFFLWNTLIRRHVRRYSQARGLSTTSSGMVLL